MSRWDATKYYDREYRLLWQLVAQPQLLIGGMYLAMIDAPESEAKKLMLPQIRGDLAEIKKTAARLREDHYQEGTGQMTSDGVLMGSKIKGMDDPETKSKILDEVDQIRIKLDFWKSVVKAMHRTAEREAQERAWAEEDWAEEESQPTAESIGTSDQGPASKSGSPPGKDEE
jgi:hypothetical protein